MDVDQGLQWPVQEPDRTERACPWEMSANGLWSARPKSKITHVQQWHQAHGEARLDNMVSDWGVPIRNIAKLKNSSLLRILAFGAVLLA